MDQKSPRPWLTVVAAVALTGLILLAAFTLPTNRAVAVTTAILVIVTLWYAWQTRQMVSQMESAREAQIRPHLALSVELERAGGVFLRVANAGVGPALSVDVRIESEAGSGVMIPYMTPVLAPGAGQSFIVRDGTGQAVSDLKQLVHTLQAKRVKLTGTFTDALGRGHQVEDSLSLEEYSDAYYSRTWRAQSDDQLKRIADALEGKAGRRSGD
jgi:hypothetical protein